VGGWLQISPPRSPDPRPPLESGQRGANSHTRLRGFHVHSRREFLEAENQGVGGRNQDQFGTAQRTQQPSRPPPEEKDRSGTRLAQFQAGITEPAGGGLQRKDCLAHEVRIGIAQEFHGHRGDPVAHHAGEVPVDESGEQPEQTRVVAQNVGIQFVPCRREGAKWTRVFVQRRQQ